MIAHVLIAVEPEKERERIRRLVRGKEVVCVTLDRARSLRSRLVRGDFDLLVISRSWMPEPPVVLIDAVRALPERPEIVVLADREDAKERASLLGAGCLAVLTPDPDDEVLGRALTALIERRRGDAHNRLQADRPEEAYSLKDFVSESPAMQLFVDLARRVVPSDTSVLILGETGVGKERLARAIHSEGPRASGPFMAVNCGAIPESLLESELFGHEEGAFTGATRARKGYFELAHRGTLFLDEIGEMPAHLQVKLLRAVDRGEIQRVGADGRIEVDVRVMAATNRDLEADMGTGAFRSDLYYRLAVVTLTVPPLRERREDVSRLVESYIEHFAGQTGKRVLRVDPRAMSALTRYDWPGNVRELINCVERAVLLCTSTTIGLGDLPNRVAEGTARAVGNLLTSDSGASLPAELLAHPLAEARKRVVSAFESRYLASLLEDSRGRVGEAARRAGVNERTLYSLMRRNGLRKEDFKRRGDAQAGTVESE